MQIKVVGVAARYAVYYHQGSQRKMLSLKGRRVLLAGCVSLIAGAKCFTHSKAADPEPKVSGSSPGRVAVVGAGVGGCTAAYFLRQLGGDTLDVHVFEKDTVGGRTDVIEFDGHKYECGASVIHSTNKYLADLSQRFGM